MEYAPTLSKYKNLIFLCCFLFGAPIVVLLFSFVDKPVYTGKTICGSIFEMTKSGGGHGAGQRGMVLHDFANVRLDTGGSVSIEQAIGRKIGDRVSYKIFSGAITGRITYVLDSAKCPKPGASHD